MLIIKKLIDIVGMDKIILPKDANSFLKDWRHRFHGNTIAVVQPKTTIEVSKIIKLCIDYKIAVVPQGGNTGLCGGATPDKLGNSIILSLKRMNIIRSIDIENDSIIVESGCILKDIQDYVAKNNRYFPLSIAAQGTCTIGGNLSTNAGGTQVLRYGNARDFALGLEVVTAEGNIWHGLRSLRKDNSGYSLKDLYIGSEGTLGIITAAALKIYPSPKNLFTALFTLESIDHAVQFLSYCKSKFASNLVTFEIISKNCFDLSLEYLNEKRFHLYGNIHPWFLMLEINDYEYASIEFVENILLHAIEINLIQDAIVARNLAQRNFFWKIRESIPLAEFSLGKAIKHDISLPISQIARFIKSTNFILESYLPGIQSIIFGHLGDGNLHYNITKPFHMKEEDFLSLQHTIYDIVHSNVYKFNGSICAEHGVGQLKRNEIKKYKNEIEIDLMKKIKNVLDPFNIMNPGKVL